MVLNLEQIMERIKRMQNNVQAGEKEKTGKKKEGPSDEEIRSFVQQELAGNGEESKDTRAARHIADLMARNPKLKRELKESLPTADKVRKEKMKQLREAASRTGMKKLKEDFRGHKKKAAQAELKKIGEDKRRIAGDKEIDEKAVSKSISTGRGRHIGTFVIQPIVNSVALGSNQERHKNIPLPENIDPEKKNSRSKNPQEKNSTDINFRTAHGMLKGKVYEPKDPTGKVAIIFSGSAGPSGEYTPKIAEEYLKAGVKVVCMDYRGFGNSESQNKKGKKISTYPSEESIYQDGKDMLHYVIDKDKMNVKPENVILHGYSLGGAVASKVAADYTQEQQKQALEQGKTVHKLGGVVLHSAIDKMSDVATRETNCVMGFGGWAFGGGYNTRSHMQRLSKLDPDIPVHYVSGSKNAVTEGKKDPDELSLEITKLHQDPEAQFKNSSVWINGHNHTGPNYDISENLEMLSRDRGLQPDGPEKDLEPQLGRPEEPGLQPV